MSRFRGRPGLVLLVVSLGSFMTLLDLTIVNIAIPNMITTLHAPLDDMLWVINAYALVLAVLVITAGRLGDLIGQRLMFAAGIAVFTVASAACGLAPGPGWLIAFRTVQGLGAAMLTPQTLVIITMTFPPQRRGAAFGIWGAVAGVATIAGPTAGGLLVTAFGWRSIFFANLPIGVVVLVLTGIVIPGWKPGQRHRLDVPGVMLASAALLAICYGLVEGQKYSWGKITSAVSIPLVLGAGVLLLAAFLVLQRRTQASEPLVPFALFRNRNYSVVNWVSGVLAIGMIGIFLPFTIYLQSVLGFSPLKAGLTEAPASLVSAFAAPLAGRMADKIGGKHLLMSGLILFGTGMGWMTLIAHQDSTWPRFLLPMSVAGLGMGCIFPPLLTIAMAGVQPQMAGAASGFVSTVRQGGLVIGTATVGALLQNRLMSSISGQVTARSAALPSRVRGRVIAEIRDSANNGVQLGATPHGDGMKAVPAVSHQLAAQIAKIGHDVFISGYVTAMRETIVLPIVLLGAGAASCLAIRRPEHATSGPTAADRQTPRTGHRLRAAVSSPRRVRVRSGEDD